MDSVPHGKDVVLYWRFVANVLESGDLALRWSYLSPRPAPKIEKPDREHRVILLRGDGSKIASYEVSSIVSKDGRPRKALAAAIPFHPLTARITIVRDDVLLVAIEVPERKPSVKLQDSRISPGGFRTIAWEATVASREFPVASVFIELDNGRRYPLANHVHTSKLEINMDALPGCEKGRIIVRVSDGVWTAEAASEPFAQSMKPPLVWIGRPKPNMRVRSDQPLQVEGQGWDIQAQRPLSANSFQWSLDGKIVGTGRLCVIDRVAIGSHTLVLRAIDSGKRQSQVAVNFASAPPNLP